MQEHEEVLKTNIRRWAVGPGLVGALVPLLKDGERTREEHRRVRRDAGGVRKTEGEKKCGEVRGRLW